MTKLLRKYNKWLLAVLGTFLMITFLVQGTSSIFAPDPTRTVLGTLDGEKVRVADTMRASHELEVLKDLTDGGLDRIGVDTRDEMQWLLLSREAEKRGLVSNEADGKAAIADIAETMLPRVIARQVIAENEQSNTGMSRLLRQYPQLLEQLVDGRMREMAANGQLDQVRDAIQTDLTNAREDVGARANLSLDEVDMALAKLRGVMRLLSSHNTAARLSDKRLVAMAQRDSARVLADLLVIPASSAADKTLEPTPEQIAARFEKYKATDPATSEGRVGYLQPDRVKIEWITLDRQVIADSVQLDPVEVNVHWQRNKSRYADTFEAARAAVEGDLREQRVQAILAEADRAYRAVVRAATRSLPTNAAGVRTLPADWESRRPTMETLADAMVAGVRNVLKHEVPRPAVSRRTDSWVRVPEAGSLPGLGFAVLQTGGRETAFTDLIAGVHELNPAAATGVQSGVPLESALVDGNGNRYYIIVTDAKKSSPAESIDEVRDRVVQDIRIDAALDRLAQRLPEWESRAAAVGLDALAEEVRRELPEGSPTPQVQRMQPFTRTGTDPRRGSAVRDAIIARADALGVLTPATPENARERTVAVADPTTRSVFVAQIVGAQPLTQERLRMAGNFEALTRVMQEYRDAQPADAGAEGPFSIQSLKERLNWKPSAVSRERENKAERERQQSKG